VSAVTQGYWQTQYSDETAVRILHEHNRRVTDDLLAHLRAARAVGARTPGNRMNAAFRSAHSILEIGCGTGELAAGLDEHYTPAVTYATDMSAAAVKIAGRAHPKMRYEVFNVLDDWPTHLGNFDVAVASNVLQFFHGWPLVVDRMLVLATRAVVVVPYRRKVEGSNSEGGSVACSQFVKGSFVGYRVLDSFTFASQGWADGPRSRQLAVLIGPK
jgi:SAM-dependent methyltransferase